LRVLACLNPVATAPGTDRVAKTVDLPHGFL
jgi:hypothetical protein